MEEIALSLRKFSKGWRVFRRDDPLFWFPSYEEAVATARIAAALHADIGEVPVKVEIQTPEEKPVMVTRITPSERPVEQDSN